jgi:hypothetical protein
MKRKFFLLQLFLGIAYHLPAQHPVKPIPAAIPRHEAAQPTLTRPDLQIKNWEQFLDDASWRGVRIWTANNSAIVDSITAISFFLQSRQATWTKQGWEYVTPQPASYEISGNRIIIRFNYFPYKHVLDGTYDHQTKMITGTFTEERRLARNAPPAYTPGTLTGQFQLIMK